ncbi:hypothetical protein Q604_UNBC06332G0001, partial [human gut metagenome]
FIDHFYLPYDFSLSGPFNPGPPHYENYLFPSSLIRLDISFNIRVIEAFDQFSGMIGLGASCKVPDLWI